jgi:hypothetical protein
MLDLVSTMAPVNAAGPNFRSREGRPKPAGILARVGHVAFAVGVDGRVEAGIDVSVHRLVAELRL